MEYSTRLGARAALDAVAGHLWDDRCPATARSAAPMVRQVPCDCKECGTCGTPGALRLPRSAAPMVRQVTCDWQGVRHLWYAR